MRGRLPNESTAAWLERLIANPEIPPSVINAVQVILQTENASASGNYEFLFIENFFIFLLLSSN